MTTKENRPTAETVGRAGMETAAGQAAISCVHFITGTAGRQSEIAAERGAGID